MKKRILSIFMTLCMMASLFPVSVFAEEPGQEAFTEEFIEPVASLDALAEGGFEEPPHEHAYIPYVTEPTCTTQGYTTYVCDCGDSYVSDYTDALNHPQTIGIAEIPATCTTDGVSTGKQCAVCGQIVEGCEVIPATDHVPIDIAEIAATETSTGMSAGTKCAACGEILSGCEEISVLQPTQSEDDVSETAESEAETEEEAADVQLEEETANQDAKNAGSVASGTCGDNLTWILDEEGSLVISGNGNMTYYSYATQVPWNYYKSQIIRVIMQNGVSDIGTYAFQDCSNLTSITIPEGVTKIGYYTFRGCNSLTSVTLPDGVTYIGGYAFQDCSNLVSITIPDSVTDIREYAFSGCSSLTGITIPNGVTNISQAAFSLCSSLTGFTIPDSVTEIREYAFSGCSSLTSIVVPQSVTRIWSGAFEDCSSLMDITIPDGVTRIEDCTFWGCSSLTDITIPNGVNYIGENAFISCSSLTNITLPVALTTIGYGTFGGCSSLTSILIPENVTSIEIYAFSGCSGLSSITIPNSVTSIGESAFNECTGLTKVILPPNLTSMGGMIFSDCNGLTSAGPIGSECNIEFGWTESIPKDAFCGSNNLTSITIPDGVTNIGTLAFSGCSSLISITIPTSMTTIGESAFYNCSSLSDVYYSGTPTQWNAVEKGSNNDPLLNAEVHFAAIASGTCGTNGDNLTWTLDENGVLTISGSGAMEDYTSSSTRWGGYSSQIRTVVIEDGATSIGNDAFSGCSGLTSVAMSEIITNIGNYAFRDCSGLTSVTIPESVTSIGIFAFDGCSGLTSVTIPESVTSIGSYAFYNCLELKSAGPIDSGCSIEFGWTTSIPSNAFSDCNCLTSVTIPESVTSIESYTFRGCSGLTSVTIPESVTTIDIYAFKGCSGLTSVTIPGSVTSIGNYAFCNCSGLTSVTIPESVTNIGGFAFYNCSSLSDVYYSGTPTQWNAVEKGSNNDPLLNAEVHFAAIASGTCGTNGDNLTWTLDENGVLTISGSGAMEDYSSSSIKWGGYSIQIRTVVIEDGATSIGDNAFSGCSGLTSVTILGSVTSIGERAFQECSSLKSMTIPEGVTSIGLFAFSSCKGLTNVTIPKSVTSMGGGAFSGCRGLTNAGPIGSGCSIEFGWTTSIPGHAFDTCSGLTSVTIPEGVTSIGAWAFDGCSSLTNVTIPESVTSIGDFAFSYCRGLTSVTIPENVTSIGSSAFSSCNGLTNAGPIGSGCSIEFGWTTSIPNKAFFYCSSLTSITIPRSVISIGSYAFYNCNNLSDVYYAGTPTQWNAIGKGSSNDPLLNAEVHFAAIASGTCGANGDNLTWTLDENCVLTISGSGDMANYSSSSTRWGGYYSQIETVIMEDGATSIGQYAFYNCSGLTSVTIPESVTNIGNYAFYGCSGLTSAGPIGSGCDYEFGWTTSIPDQAFHGCSGLTSIMLPDSVTSIGEEAFDSCRSLTGITLPDGLTSIGNWAFCYCESLTSITLPDSITSIGHNIFGGNCKSLASVTIPGSVTSFGESTFDSSPNLTSAGPIGSGCSIEFGWTTSIPDRVFENCVCLTSITLPDSVTSIGDYAFSCCNLLTGITLPDGVTSIGEHAFENCGSLTSIMLPDSVKSIGELAFAACKSVTSITLPDSITSIGEGVFCGCSSLSDVHYSGTPAQWAALEIGSNNDPLLNAEIHFAGIVAYGTCGENLIWMLDEAGVLTISGSGAMTDYSSASTRWDSHFSEIKTVVIENGATSIGTYAFYNCYNIKSITIPDSVTSIGYYAFNSCNNLENITIPGSVTSIGLNAFQDCNSLENAGQIGSGSNYEFGWTTTIPAYAFAGCYRLTSVSIPDGVTGIDGHAFENCFRLKSITLPEGLTRIGSSAFEDCSRLTNIIIPNSVTDLGYYAFSGCGSLSSIIIPDNVTTISTSCFYNCSNLANITIPSGVMSIGENAFSNCANLKSVDFLGDSPSIAASAFNGVTATCNYICNKNWQQEDLVNYGGTLTWVTGHIWDEGRTTTEPTCTDEGVKTYSCTREGCGATRTEPVASLGHTPVVDAAVAATCEGTGLTEGSHCSVCGVILQAQEEIPALGHIWDEGRLTMEATCIEEGVKTYSCTREGCGETRTEPVAGLGRHTPEVDEAVAATCEGTGLTEGLHCSVCGAILQAQEEIPAFGHTWGKGTITRESTCTEDGEETYSCTFEGCGATMTVPIASPGHTPVVDAAVAPTCEGTGLTGGNHCSVCGVILQAQEELPALGHLWDEGSVTVEPTYGSEGEKHFTCTRGCGTERVEAIPRLTPPVGWMACGDHLLWKYDSSTRALQIEGTGDMWDGSIPWTGYKNMIIKVEIGDEVTSLACGAFKNMIKLNSVVIPTSIASIAEDIFSGCGALKSITIPENIIEISESAFENAGLETIVFEGSVPSISPTAFANVTATVHYPCNKDWWQEDLIDYGGTLTWVADHAWDEGTVRREASCAEEGERTFVCVYNNSHTKTEPIPVTNHVWGDPAWTWDGTESATATFTCKNDSSHVNTVTASGSEITKETDTGAGEEVYTATINVDGETYTDIKRVAITQIALEEMTLLYGESKTIAITGNEGLTVQWESSDPEIAEISTEGVVTGKKVGNATITATAGNSSANCEVHVLFTDVTDETAYFYHPVYWALSRGVTSGTSPATFSPGNPCTRGQIVTFLWKAMGSPEPTSLNNPFIDVSSDDYFYKPVLWAKENGITSGTSATTFSPYNPCTRGQIVTFLWIAKGRPEPSSTENPFTDVGESDYFFKPVLWARENSITSGTSPTTFSPYNPCTRAQSMTFLYKAIS